MNTDHEVVRDFGREWDRFDQSDVPEWDLKRQFDQYFAGLDWATVPGNAKAFDCGCGSGRWARFIAPKVAELHCIDPSAQALSVARRNLAGLANCRFHEAGVDAMPIADYSMDFGYCLGVLHHVPDTAAGIAACARKLKRGAPFVIYLYYAFDNRPSWFVAIWKVSDAMRRVMCRLPFGTKRVLTDVIAATVYWPLARLAKVISTLGVNGSALPLFSYRDRTFYSMRTDALDRFGTKLEKRFTKPEIERMLLNAGFRDIRFNAGPPYWCATAIKD